MLILKFLFFLVSLIYVPFFGIYLFVKSKTKLLFVLLTLLLISHQNFVFNNQGEIKNGEVVKIKVISNLNHSDYNTSFIGLIDHQKYQIKTKLNKQINYNTTLKARVKEVNSVENRWLNPSSFDTKKYYASNLIFKQIEVEEVELINNNSFLAKLRSYREKEINNNFKSKEIYNALVFGDKDFSDENKVLFQTTGIIHIFSVSGMHVIFLFSLIKIICLILKLTKKTSKYITLVFSSIYFFLAGENIPIFRSVITNNVSSFYNISKIKILNYLVLILLILNPFLIYNLGAILSFFITYSLLLIKENKEFRLSWFLFIIGIPLVINTSYQINLFTPLINLFVIPIITVILLPLCWLLFFTKLSVVDEIIYFIYNSLLDGLNIMNNLNIVVGFMSIFILSLISYLIYKLITIKKSKYFYLLLVIICVNPRNIDNNFISFIDVNQGDSILVSTNFKKNNILIDTGNVDSKNEVIKYLHYQGISKIDCLIITHFDDDHCANIDSLVKTFKIKNIISSDINSDYKYTIIKKDTSFNFGSFKFNLIPPKKIYEKANNNSLVILLEIKKTKFLLTGDIEEQREEELINNKLIRNIDYLKVAHHGSKTSSNINLLKEINPKVAIISCGKNNMYKHPHPDVVNRLKQLEIKIYQTNVDGNILISKFK